MRIFSADTLESAIRRLLTARGLAAAHVADVSAALVQTSLDGIDTHGVRLLKTYIQELDGGRAKRKPNMQLQGALPAIGVLDADDALGAVAMSEAMRIACDRAAQFGIAAVAVANSNHFGAAGHYARIAVQRGQVGMIFSNSDALVVPYGGTQPLNGTNPLAVAAPGEDGDNFMLDMATSQAAFSRVSQALDMGLHVDSNSLHGSRIVLSGAHTIPVLQPLGGVKGQGLGMAIQILCALLTAMPFDAELSHLYAAPYDKPRKIAHFVIAIEISAFVPIAVFRARLGELHEHFRASMPSGESPVIVPGDRERASRAERLRNGIPIDDELFFLLEPFMETQD